jgi:hypothetical protein
MDAKRHLGIYLLAVALAAASVCVGATPPPPSTTHEPPVHYCNPSGMNHDARGSFKVLFNYVTGPDQLGEHPIVWVEAQG